MQIYSVVFALSRQINKQKSMRKQLISFAQVIKFCKVSYSRGGFNPKNLLAYALDWNCCCIQILVILITLKLQIGACNGQISTFKLSIIIMRHEGRVLLRDHRTFVVGPFIFSFS